jgi:hypothetical protein
VLGLSTAHRRRIGVALLEQITVAQVTASRDCTPLGLAPVSRLKVLAVGAAGFQDVFCPPSLFFQNILLSGFGGIPVH